MFQKKASLAQMIRQFCKRRVRKSAWRKSRAILSHILKEALQRFSKAMIVCMSRRICVGLCNELIKLRPDWRRTDVDKGQLKIVMTSELTKDPKEWSEAGHITTKERREQIKARLKDPDDPLKMVIVRDMWPTGTDIPCLHTLYVDKPMRDKAAP